MYISQASNLRNLSKILKSWN